MDHGLKLVRPMWELPKIRGTLFGVLIIRILLIRVLYLGPPFSENPKSPQHVGCRGQTLTLKPEE